MKFRTAIAGAVFLAAGMLLGCTGVVDGAGNATPGAGGGASTTGPVGTATNTAGAPSSTTAPGGLNLDGSPKYYRVIRVSNTQWANSVQQILALSAPSGLEQKFQAVVQGTTDFSNNELLLDVDQESWGEFQTAAETLAAQVTATDAALAKVYSGTDAAGFISTFGRRAYRRPLTAAEQATYLTLFNQGSSLTGTRSTFAKGASLVIRAMLQSPYFLYRTELGTSKAPLSTYEIAAKLSLWLLGTTPSDALLDSAAGPGKLDTADGAAAVAQTMLENANAAAVMRQFHSELVHFERYALISKVNVPTYTTALNTELQDVSSLFFDKIFAKNLGLKDILTSTSGFVGAGTAPLYGLKAPASGTYTEMDLGAQRVGYFLQIPFLALYGFNAEPDSIHRGVSLNLDVLCAKLGPPAKDLPPIPPLMPGQTNRQRIDTLTSGCGAECHNSMINPLGFSFEHFDGMGQYRDTENGLAIDSSGTYQFASGTKSFADAASLMRDMAADSQAHLCYAKKLSSFGLQRDVVAADQPLLQTLATASMAQTGSVKNLIMQLVRSDAFRTRAGGN